MKAYFYRRETNDEKWAEIEYYGHFGGYIELIDGNL